MVKCSTLERGSHEKVAGFSVVTVSRVTRRGAGNGSRLLAGHPELTPIPTGRGLAEERVEEQLGWDNPGV